MKPIAGNRTKLSAAVTSIYSLTSETKSVYSHQVVKNFRMNKVQVFSKPSFIYNANVEEESQRKMKKLFPCFIFLFVAVVAAPHGHHHHHHDFCDVTGIYRRF